MLRLSTASLPPVSKYLFMQILKTSDLADCGFLFVCRQLWSTIHVSTILKTIFFPLADCAFLPVCRQLRSGRLDHLPITLLDKFPKIVAFENKMMAIPAVKTHYASCAAWYRYTSTGYALPDVDVSKLDLADFALDIDVPECDEENVAILNQYYPFKATLPFPCALILN
jgi:hypothetical protein